METLCLLLFFAVLSFFLLRLLLHSAFRALRLAIRWAAGLICLCCLNRLSGITGICIPITPLTAAAAGTLGVPGMVLLLLLSLLQGLSR